MNLYQLRLLEVWTNHARPQVRMHPATSVGRHYQAGRQQIAWHSLLTASSFCFSRATLWRMTEVHGDIYSDVRARQILARILVLSNLLWAWKLLTSNSFSLYRPTVYSSDIVGINARAAFSQFCDQRLVNIYSRL